MSALDQQVGGERCKAGRKNGKILTARLSRWVIDGDGFSCVAGAYAVAKLKGARLTLGGFTARLKAGEVTWDELIRPSKNGDQASKIKACKATRQRKRDEMAALIASLDKRKRDMGEGP